MQLQLIKGKIHRARLTHCDLDYEGSLEIDINYLNKAEILPYEKILVVNATNGERLETYAIPGEPGSKVFRLNGAAAHKGSVGDIVTIMAFGILDEQEARNFQPKVIVLDENNEIIAVRRGRTPPGPPGGTCPCRRCMASAGRRTQEEPPLHSPSSTHIPHSAPR